MPYSPLGKGFLTGQIDASATFGQSDLRARIPRFEPEALKHNLALVAVLSCRAHAMRPSRSVSAVGRADRMR